MGKTKTALSVLLCFLITFILCKCSNNNVPTTSFANAGEDQISYVGSYAILDPSDSYLYDESLYLTKWYQSPDNPEESHLLVNSELYDKNIIYFAREGSYQFYLDVECVSGAIYSDTISIEVLTQQNSVIEDLELEIIARYWLKLQEGELTQSDLCKLDSLANIEMMFEDKITSLEGLQYCKNLECLGLMDQSLTDLSPIKSLTKLEYLNFTENHSNIDISPISNLTNLKFLNIDDNLIEDISAIGSLINLKELYLTWNPITDISSLANLRKIEILYLGNGGFDEKISSIEPLSGLTTLKDLFLSGENLTSINYLENLTNLQLLYISHNSISDITPLHKMKKLERLIIENNSLISLTGISELENLNYLNADNNQISDISELKDMAKLKLFGLRGNQIENIKPILDNPNIDSDCGIYLNGNPLDSISINEYIPQLKAKGIEVFF